MEEITYKNKNDLIALIKKHNAKYAISQTGKVAELLMRLENKGYKLKKISSQKGVKRSGRKKNENLLQRFQILKIYKENKWSTKGFMYSDEDGKRKYKKISEIRKMYDKKVKMNQE